MGSEDALDHDLSRGGKQGHIHFDTHRHPHSGHSSSSMWRLIAISTWSTQSRTNHVCRAKRSAQGHTDS